MNNYLYNIASSISQVGDEYHVIYAIDEGNITIVGGCNYKEWKNKSKLQSEPVYILTQVYMVDIISYINEKSPLNEGDLTKLQMEIRTDSLNRLKEFVKEGIN